MIYNTVPDAIHELMLIVERTAIGVSFVVTSGASDKRRERANEKLHSERQCTAGSTSVCVAGWISGDVPRARWVER